MDNIERDFKIEYELDWEYSIEISKLKEDLDAIEKLGATHVEITAYVSYDCAYITMDALCKRVETDEECLKRTEDLDERKEQHKQRELEQLKKLKEKYETNSN